MTEILLVIVITAGLLVPLVGWSTFAVKYQQDVDKTNDVAAAIGLLQTYFARDVATADHVDTTGPSGWSSCAGGTGHTVKLALGSSRPHPARTVAEPARMQRTLTLYTEAPRVGLGGPEVAGQTSLFRRQCNFDDVNGDAPGGIGAEGTVRQDELVEDINPGVLVRCWPSDPSKDDYCSTVTIDLTPVKVPVPTQVRAKQVAMTDSVAGSSATGFEAPTVQISTTPDPVVLPNLTVPDADKYKVTFNATADVAAGRSVTGWSWQVLKVADGSTAPGFAASTTATFTHNFNPATHSGKYIVFVTVTDNTGATGTAYRLIDPANRPPVVDFWPQTDPIVIDRCESQTFNVSWGGAAWASYDPDGPDDLVQQPSWSITTGTAGDGDDWRAFITPSVKLTGLGLQSASLTLRDTQGATATKTRTVRVNRGTPVFRTYNNASEADTKDPTIDGEPRSLATANANSFEVLTRAKDYRCGGDINYVEILKCNVAPVGTPPRCPPASGTPQEGPPAYGTNAERMDVADRCTELSGAIDNSEPTPCTRPSPLRWERIEANPARVIPESEVTTADELPGDWYYRIKFGAANGGSALSAGTYYARVCTPGQNPGSLPADSPLAPIRCTNSRTFPLA